VRITTLLPSLLGLEGTRVLDVEFDTEGLVVDVAPAWRIGRRSERGDLAPGYDRGRGRRWRHPYIAIFVPRRDTLARSDTSDSDPAASVSLP
jgi:hypothetical protein